MIKIYGALDINPTPTTQDSLYTTNDMLWFEGLDRYSPPGGGAVSGANWGGRANHSYGAPPTPDTASPRRGDSEPEAN